MNPLHRTRYSFTCSTRGWSSCRWSLGADPAPATQHQPPAAAPTAGTHARPVPPPARTESSLQGAETRGEATRLVVSVCSSARCPFLGAFDSLVPPCSSRDHTHLLESCFQSQREVCSYCSQHHGPQRAGRGHTQTPEESWRPKAHFKWLLAFLPCGRISPIAPTRAGVFSGLPSNRSESLQPRTSLCPQAG